MSRVDWSLPGFLALPPIRSDRAGDDSTGTSPAGWVEIHGLARPAGRARDRQRAERDQWFGRDGWRQGWAFERRVIARPEALVQYEEAYVHFLRQGPELLDWICRTASEVYDNALSNLESGLDYGIQETAATHMQDIAIRRAVLRLERRLAGDHPVEIRGHESEGFCLNPGQVPFHRPDEIVPLSGKSWWEPESVEAFWQHNKVLLVDPGALRLKPAFLGPEGLWGEMGPFAVLVPRGGGLVTTARPLRAVRALHSRPASERQHGEIHGAPELDYSTLCRMLLPPVRIPEQARLVWGSDLG